MRPIKLTMEAFGSYGKKTVIDFDVSEQNIFLITGDTGAGKSTIFDAIVFALYGEASSSNNKKDGLELQSQYAGLDSVPYVMLDFTETTGGETKVYSVKRVPRHRKASRKDPISEKVSLVMPDGTEYPQKEVDRKLEEIVGLTKNQFMQVAMIAQGEFMDLLQKKTTEKKEIFRKLFNTDIYKRIIDELADRSKEKKKQIAQIRTICRQEISHIQIPEYYEEADLLEEKKRNIRESERMNTAEVEALMKLLKKLCEELGIEKSRVEKQEREASKRRDEKMKAVNEAEGLLQSFQNLERAQAERKKCDDEKEAIEGAESLSKRIRYAYEIENHFKRFEDAKKTVGNNRRDLDRNKEKLPGLKEEWNNAKKEETTAEREAQEKLRVFSATKEKAENDLNTFAEIEKQEKLAKKKEKEVKQAVQAKEETDGKLQELLEQEQTWKMQSEELKDTNAILEKWKSKNRISEELGKEIADIENAETEMEEQGQSIQAAKKKYEEVSRQLNRKEDAYNNAYWAFWNEQAGIMARNLKEGEPCPVCGSLVHPSPAQVSDVFSHLDREALEALEAERDIIKKEFEELAGNIKITEELQRERHRNLSEKLSGLYDKITDYIGEIRGTPNTVETAKTIHDWQKAVEEEGTLLKEKEKKFGELQNALKQAEAKKGDLQKKVDEAIQNAGLFKEELSKLEGKMKALKGNLHYSSKEEAIQEQTQKEQGFRDAKGVHEDKRELSRQLKEQVDKAEALIGKYEKELPEQEEELRRREYEYEQVMESTCFAEHEWKDIISKHEKSEVDALLQKINDHRERFSAAERAIKDAMEYIGDRKKPDLDALKAAYETAEEAYAGLKERLKQVEECYKTNYSVYEALAPKMKERASVVEEHDRIEGLHNRLAGKVSGARMDIETFVQRYYLERILYAANRRFRDMSAGQYELKMVNIDQAGEGKNRGLDLMVYSEVTGKEREVRTLSGGESFMAALSLALGMADQIQEGSAAIGLDMMFIDEGFGSLDDHSRGQAVKVLKQMAGGSRLIGIISHVSDLKQEIEDQLYIAKDDYGSHAQWNN